MALGSFFSNMLANMLTRVWVIQPKMCILGLLCHCYSRQKKTIDGCSWQREALLLITCLLITDHLNTQHLAHFGAAFKWTHHNQSSVCRELREVGNNMTHSSLLVLLVYWMWSFWLNWANEIVRDEIATSCFYEFFLPFLHSILKPLEFHFKWPFLVK